MTKGSRVLWNNAAEGCSRRFAPSRIGGVRLMGGDRQPPRAQGYPAPRRLNFPTSLLNHLECLHHNTRCRCYSHPVTQYTRSATIEPSFFLLLILAPSAWLH